MNKKKFARKKRMYELLGLSLYTISAGVILIVIAAIAKYLNFDSFGFFMAGALAGVLGFAATALLSARIYMCEKNEK